MLFDFTNYTSPQHKQRKQLEVLKKTANDMRSNNNNK